MSTRKTKGAVATGRAKRASGDRRSDTATKKTAKKTARTTQTTTSKKATVSKTATKTAASTRSTATATKTSAVAATKPGPVTPSTPAGHVSFVGSGPGDPDLLTVRAVELIRNAEVVVTEVPGHVQLVRRVLGLPQPTPGLEDADNGDLGPTGPEIVDGGFGQDGQPLTHAGRAKVVVKQAKSGKRVIRLMAGDPFVYASGPEEAQACVKAGVWFEIVPGVPPATAVPAYAGIR